MDMLVKGLILILFAVVVFFKDAFPSQSLYWLTYVLMFALIPVWWVAAFWVSEKKAKETLNKEYEKSFFVGMVADNPNDDLIRGRLCITPTDLFLIIKDKTSYKIAWSVSRKDITSIGIGKVVGARKGFKIYTNKSETSFTFKNAEEVQKVVLG